MGSVYGKNIKISIFGQSHSDALGVVIDGLPAGQRLDLDALQAFLERRSPGKSTLTSARRESDKLRILSGLKDNLSCGAPLAAIIENNDRRPEDYAPYAHTPRPGHADYSAYVKYGDSADLSGGGHFSGRLTAALCIAGGICIQLLKARGIEIISRIYSIADIADDAPLLASTAEKPFPVVDDEKGAEMISEIEKAGAEGDSVGGVIECAVLGLMPGIGEPMFDGMENRIASAVFAVPAVKGIEFGAGFELAHLRGSEANDAFYTENGRVLTRTNNCGGILGGVTNGMPLCFKAAIKPTPSIAREQETVNLSTMENTVISVHGRHDKCIVPRAVPCVEAAAAIAVYDALLDNERCPDGA